MRGAVACPVRVHDLWQQHVRIVDLFRLDEDEIPVSERTLVGRFGYHLVIWKFLLLIPPFVGLYRERPDRIP